MLNALYEQNIAGKREDWQEARRARWSKFNSNQYENVIAAIKGIFPDGAGLWQVEEYWQGHQ